MLLLELSEVCEDDDEVADCEAREVGSVADETEVASMLWELVLCEECVSLSEDEEEGCEDVDDGWSAESVEDADE